MGVSCICVTIVAFDLLVCLKELKSAGFVNRILSNFISLSNLIGGFVSEVCPHMLLKSFVGLIGLIGFLNGSLNT